MFIPLHMMKKRNYLSLIALLIPFALLTFSCSTQKNAMHGSSKKNSINLDTVTVTASKSAGVYRASETKIWDLMHTKLAVSFNFQKHLLYGDAYIWCKPHFASQNTISLDAKGMDILSVKEADGNTLTYNYADSMHLICTLPKWYSKNDTLQLHIKYIAKPDQLKANGGTAITENRGLYFINTEGKKNMPLELWTQGEVEASSCWFPTLDAPNQRMTQEIYMTVPDTMVTLSNGLLLSSTKNNDATRTDYWKQSLSHPPYLSVMIAGPFHITKDSWRNKELTYYTEPFYTPYAKDIFGNTPEMLEYFSTQLGVEFPWEKYGQVIVREFVSGAMENTGAVTFYDALNQTRRDMIDGNHETIIAHELFHHWFGDLVTCESWSNLTLNESFATYGEYLWVDHKYGREQADIEMLENYLKYMSEAESKQEDLVRFSYDNPDDMFDRHSYEKGGCILHLLRNHLGDEAFFAGINKYLTQNRFASAEVPQLRMAFEEVCGQDLNWFFNQWYYNSGHPVIHIKYSFSGDTVIMDVQQKNSNEAAHVNVFNLPLKIDIYTASGKERYDMLLYKSKQQFKYISKDKPLLVNFDADKVVPGVVTQNKSTEWYIYQYKNAPLFRDRYEALVYFLDNQKESAMVPELINALHDKNSYLRRMVVNKWKNAPMNNMEVLDRIREMAQSDPSSKVRASAVYRLSKHKNKELISLYETTINDSSYMVIGASLSALCIADSAKAMFYANRYANENNHHIVYGVADVYSSWGGSAEQTYYENQLKSADAYTQIQLLYHYVNYLGKMGKKEFDIAMPTYESVLANSESEYMAPSISGSLKRLKSYYEKRKKNEENSASSLPKGDLKAINELSERITFYNDAIKYLEKIIGKAKSKMDANAAH